MKTRIQRTIFYMLGWLVLTISSVLVLPRTVFAQDPNFPGMEFDPKGNIAKATKLPTSSPENITVRAIQWVLGMLGLVSVIMILFGGFTWMTAAGNEEKITKAKGILKAAIIGLIIVMLSYAIVAFIYSQTKEIATDTVPAAP
ncbi:MAG: pilin [Patescibacteria group bacterium]|nr:pilin [Patescibacteria group bacterium]MDD5716151.1 pilin [Patescibacteria group bacterium]